MKIFHGFIIAAFLFYSCNKKEPILDDNHLKSIIRSGLSQERFYPLLKSMAIDTFYLTISKPIMDSLQIQSVIIYINAEKYNFDKRKTIKAGIDSVAIGERVLKLTCGDFRPPSSKIYGEFKVSYIQDKWVLIPLDIGILDYR